MNGVSRKNAARWMTALVALGAAFVSFHHIEHLALAEGQPFVSALIYPVIVDGLILAGSALVFDGFRAGWACVVPGIIATLFANVESGLGHGPLGAVLASWPAVAFSLASFVLERSALVKLKEEAGRLAEKTAEADERTALRAELEAASAARATAEAAARDAVIAAQREAAQAESLRRKFAARAPQTRPAKAAAAKAPDDLSTARRATEKAREIWKSERGITGKDLAARVGMSERWGQLHVKEFNEQSEQAVLSQNFSLIEHVNERRVR